MRIRHQSEGSLYPILQNRVHLKNIIRIALILLLNIHYLPVLVTCSSMQWRNTGGGGGGQSAPRHFSPENFCWPTGKREARKKGKIERKKGKSTKGRWKIEKGTRKSYQMRRRHFFFFSFTLFKTTEMCFGSTNGNFLPGKKIQEKWLCSLWKIFLLRPSKHGFQSI